MNPGDSVGNKYRIIRRLGGGAFGEVYLAQDLALACEKAIKILFTNNPQETLHKLQEGRILDRCRHKNIVQINEANLCEAGGKICVVLDIEPLPDGSIESELERRWFSIKESCQRVSEMLAGLHFAHSNGYLHRDIKPANILIDGNNTKLSDFGLATDAFTCIGSSSGYLPHCPPEFYTSHLTSIQTDIFASGITLFRIVNNIKNWRNRLATIRNWKDYARQATLLKVIGFETYVSKRIQNIIKRACHADLTKRYQSASAFKADIDALRYNIDWTKNSGGVWAGVANEDKYTFKIVSRRKGYEVRCLKNGRSLSQYLRFAQTESEIEGLICTVISQTTLK